MRRHRSIRSWLLLAALLKVGAGGTALAFAQTSEAELKAAFTYTLSKYIEWPAERLPEGAALRVCSPNNNPIIAAMQSLVGKAVRSHPLEIHIGPGNANMNTCHVLVLPADHPRVPQRHGLLTVTDSGALREDGGMVALGIDNNRVSFEVNLAAARQQGLNPSAQVLKLARRVIGN
jgi:hypothetical protein